MKKKIDFNNLGSCVRIFGTIGMNLFIIIGILTTNTSINFILSVLTGIVGGCLVGFSSWGINKIIKNNKNVNKTSSIEKEEVKTNRFGIKNLKVNKNLFSKKETKKSTIEPIQVEEKDKVFMKRR